MRRVLNCLEGCWVVLIHANVFFDQGFQEQMMQNLSQMTDVIDPLAAAAKAEPENIGHRVCSVLCTAFALLLLLLVVSTVVKHCLFPFLGH